jgi:hypothetical protein
MQRKMLEQQLPPTGVKTTALPRPNSYIPPDICKNKFICHNKYNFRDPKTIWSVRSYVTFRARLSDASHYKTKDQRNRILNRQREKGKWNSTIINTFYQLLLKQHAS